MTRAVFVAPTGPGSGTALVVLGVVDLLARRVARVGFFRPVVTRRPDPDVALIRGRYRLAESAEELSCATLEEAERAMTGGTVGELLLRVLDTYTAIAARYDVVVCEGVDVTGSALAFELNARIAETLSAPVVAVVGARGADVAEVARTVGSVRGALAGRGLTVLATVVNRADPAHRDAIAGSVEDVHVLPETADLRHPSVGEVADALGAHWVTGGPEDAHREIRTVQVAAMNLPHFLDRLAPGALVITPGDRADIIVGTAAAVDSGAYPPVAGLLLAGGLEVEAPIRRLLAARTAFPVLAVDTDTYATATAVSGVEPVIAPDDARKVATALATVERHLDGDTFADRLAVTRTIRVTPVMFEYALVERARAARRRIVLPEGTDDRVLRAADILARRDIVDLTVLGPAEEVRARAAALGLAPDAITVVDPHTSPWRGEFARTYAHLRRHRGVSEAMAADLVVDVAHFGTLMVHAGHADGMVSGAAHSTAHTIRPALEVLRAPGGSLVSSVFFMLLTDRVLVYGDCAIVPQPTTEQLAEIAIASADTAALFGVEPRVAMLSYSTGGSGSGEEVERVRRAAALVRRQRPDIPVEGPIQYDAAVDATVARSKLPDSAVAGHATVFVFPDLDSGNTAYKAVQRSAGAVAVGPVLQGLARPVNDLSRGCTVADIVNTVAITAVQAGGAPPG